MKCKLLSLKTIEENDGKLTVFEGKGVIPFEIKRVFSIYEVSSQDIIRAEHASVNTDFFLQIVRGKVNVELDDGINREVFCLNQLNYGLYVPKMIWMKTFKFSMDAVLQVYASTTYKECIYIDNYTEFIEAKLAKQTKDR